MLEVTNIGSHSHVGSQALGEVRHRLVDVFSWQLFPGGLQGEIQLITCLKALTGVYGTFPACCSDVIINRVRIWRV